MTNYEFSNGPQPERALADAKANFRMTMMGCEPFADLVLRRLATADGTSALPDFGCEPWRYHGSNGEPDGYGIRLNFSMTSVDRATHLGATHSAYDYIKIAELDGSTLRPTALLEELKSAQPSQETAEDAARAITVAYIGAYNDLQNTEVAGDTIVFDPMTGIAELESVLDGTVRLESE